MSNRRRRIWLLQSRVEQIARHDLGDILGNFLERDDATMAEYKGLVRSTFALIERAPLRFPDNLHGSDSRGGSLVNIQGRNARRLFDLLRDDLSALVDGSREFRLWWDYQNDLESALAVFEQAREMLAPLRWVHAPWRADPQWTATASRAVRALPGCRRSVFQYASDFGSALASARKFWKEAVTLEDHQVYAVLSLDQAFRAVQSTTELLRRFEGWASEHDISDDDDDALRDEVCRWEREDFGVSSASGH